MSLQVRTLDFHYHPTRPVLRGVSALIAPGRVTAIIGPNGSGKSTLLRLLAGVQEPVAGNAGSISWEGATNHQRSAARRAAFLGYLPQRPSLAEPLSVAQVVRLGRFALPRDEAAVQAAIQVVGLGDRAEDPFGELSAGQQQRASLARVLAQLAGGSGGGGLAGSAHTPAQVILADEPVSAQDPRHVTDIMELLREQTRSGGGGAMPQALRGAAPRTVVVVLHDFTLAARYADEVLALTQTGTVAAHGPTPQTLTPAMLEQVFEIPFDRGLLVPGDAASVALVARSAPAQ